MTRPRRPTGVTILTILQIISGIGEILLGTLLILAYIVATVIVGGGFLATALLLLGFVAFGLGVLSFALAYGLWAGKGWAWGLSFVGAIIGLIFGVFSLVSSLIGGLTLGNIAAIVAGIVPLILYLLIIVYLNTRNVRAFFGRAGVIAFGPQMGPAPGGPTYMPQAQPAYTQPPPQQAYYQQQGAYPQSTPVGTVACSYCGTPNNSSANFCDNCGNRIR
jgi:membrane protease YdiL (CAAX protease family)